MFATGMTWIVVLVIPMFALVPDITLRIYRSVFTNPWYQIVDERDKKLIREKEERSRIKENHINV
jgi:hypothetical protein